MPQRRVATVNAREAKAKQSRGEARGLGKGGGARRTRTGEEQNECPASRGERRRSPRGARALVFGPLRSRTLSPPRLASRRARARARGRGRDRSLLRL